MSKVWKGRGRAPAGWPTDARGKPLQPDVVAMLNRQKAVAVTADRRKAPDPRFITTGERPENGGSAPFELTDAGYAVITDLARNGSSVQTIAAHLGIGNSTFLELRKRDPRAQAALDEGLGALETELVDLLLERARNGCVVSSVYLAKARCRMWDRPEPKAPEAPPAPVVLNLPVMSEEQFARMMGQSPAQKVIEHD